MKIKGLEEYIDVDFIDEKSGQFEINDHKNTSLKYKEKSYDNIGFYRSFPLTQENIFISVKSEDETEIGLIRDLNDVKDKKLVEVIENKLYIRYFCPYIEVIDSLKEEYGYCYFKTKTSAGSREFIINGHDRPLIKIDEERFQVTDMDGNRYFLKNFKEYEDKHIKIVENLL
jgi:hypothetical protein